MQHAYSNPIPFKKMDQDARQYLYDEQATHMLQLFDTSATTEGELHDYTTLAAARGYVQPEQQAITNEQLLQNYMLQSQLFFTQPVATPTPIQQSAAPPVVPQPSSIVQPQVQQTPQRRRTYNRTPRNHHVYEEEPEPPKKEVMCFSVQGNEQKAKQAKPTEPDDIEEMLDTYFIVNDKNGTAPSSGAANNGMILGN